MAKVVSSILKPVLVTAKILKPIAKVATKILVPVVKK